jgi:nucleotide-binding universal stress UspA family protein
LPEAPVMANPAFVAELTDRAERALKQLAEPLRARAVTTSTRLQEGPAHAIVLRAQEIGAEMIVMGTHGRSGFRRFLLGSTTERVVRTATVPVLTVHLPE